MLWCVVAQKTSDDPMTYENLYTLPLSWITTALSPGLPGRLTHVMNFIVARKKKIRPLRSKFYEFSFACLMEKYRGPHCVFPPRCL